MERKRYFRKFDVEKALEIWQKALIERGWFDRKRKEIIPVSEALMRITAEPIFAKRSVPHYVSSAMDGIAVQSEKTVNASEKLPVSLSEEKDYVWLNTGDMLPEGFDAVVMAEFVREISHGLIEIYSPVYPYQNIRLLGEDCEIGEMLYTTGHLLKPEDISFLLSAGINEVTVFARASVLIVPTGSEIVAGNVSLRQGIIPETNSLFIGNYLKLAGAEFTVSGIVPDDPDKIKETFSSLVKDFDFIISIAGSSKGSKDLMADFIQSYGELLVHGINMKPGKPIILGFLNNIPFVGLPGYAQAAFNDLQIFVTPFISRLGGVEGQKVEKIDGKLALRIVCNPGEEHIYHGVTGRVGEDFWFYPLKNTSSAISSVTRSNSKISLSKNIEGINEGQAIEIFLKKPVEVIEKEIIFAGSHDLLIDIIAEFMSAKYDKKISIFPLGSLNGLEVMRKGRAHFTGIHMLDVDTGEYNIPFLAYLPANKFTLINLSYRIQGIIVEKGNPKNIRELKDLAREDVRFVNRQKGSGTRILLEYLMGKEGIDGNSIRGYDDVEYTHLGVGAKIHYGLADAGVGIMAVVDAFNLDFIPLYEEKYDLLFPEEFLENNGEIINIIRSGEFKDRAAEFKGYDLRNCGRKIF
jgi:putative molybdopterin biosynthesis protein